MRIDTLSTDQIGLAIRIQQHGKRALAMYNAGIVPNVTLLLSP